MPVFRKVIWFCGWAESRVQISGCRQSTLTEVFCGWPWPAGNVTPHLTTLYTPKVNDCRRRYADRARPDGAAALTSAPGLRWTISLGMGERPCAPFKWRGDGPFRGVLAVWRGDTSGLAENRIPIAWFSIHERNILSYPCVRKRGKCKIEAKENEKEKWNFERKRETAEDDIAFQLPKCRAFIDRAVSVCITMQIQRSVDISHDNVRCVCVWGWCQLQYERLATYGLCVLWHLPADNPQDGFNDSPSCQVSCVWSWGCVRSWKAFGTHCS